MNITTGYYAAMLLLPTAGAYCICTGFFAGKSLMPVRYRDGPGYRLRKWKSALMDQGQDQVFASAGLHISLKKYDAARKLLMAILLCIGLVKMAQGGLEETRKLLAAGLLFYCLTYPKQKVHGRATPFSFVMEKLKRRRANRMDEELAGIIMQMRNIILSSRQGMSANYLVTRLLPFTKLTGKAFAAALRYIRQGENEAAAKQFSQIFGTKLGDAFAAILMRLDSLPADEFKQQLDMIQKKAESERRARKNERMARANTARYTAALAEAFVIAVNFMYLIIVDSIKALEVLS